MKTLKTPWTILLTAMLATAVSAHAQAAEEEPIMKLLNEMADKPENHQAIADYYRTLASEARAEVEKHTAMRGTYRHSHLESKSGAGGQSMAQHCDRLIQNYQSTAEEYEALAMLHETEATP